jgi:dienelactone hydrolase
MTRLVALSTGAEARLRNEGAPLAAILVNGGTAKPVAGTWSATSELLATELAPRHPGIVFAEVRYRLKSWHALPSCMADTEAAVDLVLSEGAGRTLLIGFSMGGAVAIKAAGHPSVEEVVGLAPWIPERLDLSPLQGRRLVVYHGSLDRYFPGIPGVNPGNSRAGYERVKERGIDATYTLIPGALHGIAVRGPAGRPVPLPRARTWARYVASAVETWAEG